MTINVGIIGAGRSGWELHAGPLQNIPGYRLVAICDATPARLAKVAARFPVKTYDDYRALIADADVHLVVVATPNSLHATHAIAALQAGKHVIVEKPMTVRLADADAILAAAQQAGKTAVVFHNRHWDRDYQIVKAMVRQGHLGELFTVESRVMTYTPEWITYGAPEWNPAWRIQKAYGGGMINDWGPHQMEQILDLCDEWPESVVCRTRSDIWATEVEDYYSLELRMPSGLLVRVEASNNVRIPPPRWFVVGREGTLLADGTWGQWSNVRVRKSVNGAMVDMTPHGAGPTSSGRSMDVSDELSALFYGDLAKVLATGRPPEIPVTRGRDVIAILEAAHVSAASGGTAVRPAPPAGTYAGRAIRPTV